MRYTNKVPLNSWNTVKKIIFVLITKNGVIRAIRQDQTRDFDKNKLYEVLRMAFKRCPKLTSDFINFNN